MKGKAETSQLTPTITPISAVPAAAGPMVRRHDLDALRAAAMLLGIAFHVGLAFASGFPWLVQDAHRNVGFLVFVNASHGFRMPLFFLVKIGRAHV